MVSKRNKPYLILITILSLIIIVLLVGDEWLSYQQCKVYESVLRDGAYNRELRFVRHYPNSKYFSSVRDLLNEHEYEYVYGHFNSLKTPSFTSEYLIVQYRNAYKEYDALFPKKDYKSIVLKFMAGAEQEYEYCCLKNASPSVDEYEDFLQKYPSSPHRNEIEEKYANVKYSDYSLENGAQPYAQFYGRNLTSGGCSVTVKTSYSHDCLVIVKYNDENGKVAGHVYVQKSNSATINLRSGNKYQVFFYTGKGWYPEKQMPKDVKGGFLKDEQYSYDKESITLSYGETITYTLTSLPSGNFKPGITNQNSVF